VLYSIRFIVSMKSSRRISSRQRIQNQDLMKL
jgi:hypothetical protein